MDCLILVSTQCPHSFSHVSGLLHKTGERQLRHVHNIGVAKVPTPTQCQHGGDPLKINVALLDRNPRAASMTTLS